MADNLNKCAKTCGTAIDWRTDCAMKKAGQARPLDTQGQYMLLRWFRAIAPRLTVVLLAGSLCVGLAFGAQAQTIVNAQDSQAEVVSAYDALMALAVQQINSGDWRAGGRSARQAYKIARSDFEKVDAARLVASAHYRSKQFLRAEFWLRRALNNVQSGPQLGLLRQDFAKLRQDNPLSVSLRFFAAPNSNINNGSSSDTVLIWNLPFLLNADARALSGYEVSGNIGLKYRLAESKNFATDVGLTLFGRVYELSAASKKAAPNVHGSDYAFSLAEVSLDHNRRFAGVSGPTSFGLTLGKNWYGGDPYTIYARATMAQDFALSQRTSANLNFGFEHQVAVSNGDIVSNIKSIGAGLNHRLQNGDQVGFSTQLQALSSADVTAENWSKRVTLTYGFNRPIWGMQVSLNAAAEQREFDVSVYDPSGRHDLNLTTGANLLFVNLSFFGFSPSIALETNRTYSNVGLFDRDSASVRFGVQSTF